MTPIEPYQEGVLIVMSSIQQTNKARGYRR
jgi:hypothetical protein